MDYRGVIYQELVKVTMKSTWTILKLNDPGTHYQCI